MKLTSQLQALFIETAKALHGTARRVFMARTVHALGIGGQRKAERELGWSRHTVRKGGHEWRSGIKCIDGFAMRGVKPIEDRLPNLRTDIRSIVDQISQTDPTFRTMQIYRRISSAEVRRQLMAQKGYTEATVPCEETIRLRLNDMGFRPAKVTKSKPKKNTTNQRHLR